MRRAAFSLPSSPRHFRMGISVLVFHREEVVLGWHLLCPCPCSVHTREQEPVYLLALQKVPCRSCVSPVTAAALLCWESTRLEKEGFLGLGRPAAMPPELGVGVGRL